MGEEHQLADRDLAHGDLADACVAALLAAEVRVSGSIGRSLRPAGLTPAGLEVLRVLHEADGPLPPHEIGDRRLVTRGTITGVLDSLETDGLVVRQPHPDDRRMLRICLTPAGRSILARLAASQLALREDLLANLGEGDRRTLLDLLLRVGVS